jgi:hypothetical protein
LYWPVLAGSVVKGLMLKRKETVDKWHIFELYIVQGTQSLTCYDLTCICLFVSDKGH